MVIRLPGTDYITLHWKPEVLASLGLPDIGYPVPTRMVERLTASPEIEFTDMLFWIQEYSAESCQGWPDYEPAMLRLSEIIVPNELPEGIKVEGDNWCVFVAPVDLSKETVTIQRGDHLVAAIQDYGDGRLVVSAYRPLDGKSARYLTQLSMTPASDGTVCMRPNNWEYALDCSAGTGNFYAADRGEAYLSYWQFGLGISNDGSKVDGWYSQRGLMPMLSKYTALQIELSYERSQE